ncbi:MucBP domain-containing protein [Lactococcus garvieae]|uniref:MucBP domain-containing protein n=2 Tax=Lactococcus garvieae TaxID=1363 RepID=UPI000694A2E2|nr:MucBP domain-containing protein [Lactococcus garvieae]MDG6191605.1 MucBP domain-containing protein [Lactococcus garvieae]
MKKSKNILAIGILSLTYIPSITSAANTELPVNTSNEVQNMAKNIVNEKGVRNILAGSVEYSANATEFSTGDQYTGTIHLTNTVGNTISAGTKIIVAIPPTAVDYSGWNFTDPTLSSIFDVAVSAEQGTITFTLKADIIGVADISVPFFTTIIGPENTSYPVSVSSQNTDGTFTDVVVNNDQIIIPQKDNPDPSYGVLNMYWGVTKSGLSNTFVGKSPTSINNISTGIFSRNTNDIQNYIEINPEQKTVLNSNEHYEVTYEIHSTKGLGNISLNNIEVLDATTGSVVPTSDYTVTTTGTHSVSFVFLSPEQSSIKVNHKYVINLTSLATDDGDIYNSNSTLQIKNASTITKEESFPLNNIFTTRGSSVIFPSITANNKTYNSGELTSTNILEKVTSGVTATDTIDGDITGNIITDYKDLLSKKDSSGVYLNQVDYSVKNSLGYSSSRSITVTITDKQSGKDVTVKYVDTEGNKISDDVVKSGAIGDNYSTEQKDIEGYTFKEVQGNATGQFTDSPQTVTYVYTKNPVKAADVISKYVDTEGNKISDDVVKSGNIGDKYTTEEKDIDGYTFKEMGKDSAAVSGDFTDKDQTVTYVYTKNPVAAADVTAKYVDTEGNKISDDIVKSGNIGDKYTTEQKDIDGYTFKEMGKDSAAVSGDFTDKAQTVTYVYTKDKVNPLTPTPADNKPSHKENTHKSVPFSSTHNTLPETGENERMTLMSVGTGLILLMVALIASIFRFKKFKNNK